MEHPLNKTKNVAMPEVASSVDPVMGYQPNQLQMPIKKNKSDFYFKLKTRISKFIIRSQAKPYWRYGAAIPMLASSFTFITVLILLVIKYYQQLPQSIPLFFIQAEQTWRLIDKEILTVAPIVLGVILAIINQVTQSVFVFDRRLALMLQLSVLMFNILGILGILQLFSLLLIY